MMLTYTLPAYDDWESGENFSDSGSVAWIGHHLAHSRPIAWWEVSTLRADGCAWGQSVRRERIEEPAWDDGRDVYGCHTLGYCARLANGGRRV